MEGRKQFAVVGGDARQAAAARALARAGHNFIDIGRGETAYKFYSNGFHEDRIHLVIDEIVYFQYSSFETFSVP